MEDQRRRYLIASALLEYVHNEAGKPFELQRQSDVKEMQLLLQAEYSDLLTTLQQRKAAGHHNLAGTIKSVTE